MLQSSSLATITLHQKEMDYSNSDFKEKLNYKKPAAAFKEILNKAATVVVSMKTCPQL